MLWHGQYYSEKHCTLDIKLIMVIQWQGELKFYISLVKI